MENLNLYSKRGLVRSIPRKNIGIEVDFASLTEKLLGELIRYNWLIESPTVKTLDLYFKEEYMAECAYLIWGYNLKRELKKIL